MSTENAGTKKPRFTFFDRLIAAVVLVVLVAIAYVLVISPMKGTGPQKQLDFVVEVQETTLDVLELVKSGDTVTISGKSEATLKDVTFSPAKRLVLDETTGEYKNSTVPERFDISVTVTAPATENEKDISIGNMPIKVGAKMSIEGRGYSINGAVLDMTLYDENGEVAQ